MKKMKLKENSPAFDVVVGPFKGHRYSHGVEYDEAQIPPMEMKHFHDATVAPVKGEKSLKAVQAGKSEKSKVEKSA